MYTDISAPSHLDEVRRRSVPAPIDPVLVQVISLLPAAELPRLRRVSALWRAVIDLELTARIGPTVLDAGGVSAEMIEFWIRAGRGEELVDKIQHLPRDSWVMLESFHKLLPYLSHIPTLREWALASAFMGEPEPPFDVGTKALHFAMIQLIRDRPLVALRKSCARLWRSLASRWIQYTTIIPLASTWRQYSTCDTAHYMVVYGYRSRNTLDSTYRDFRLLILLDISQNDLTIPRLLIESGFLTMTPVLATMMISVVVTRAIDGDNTRSALRFVYDHCAGLYDPALDDGYARNMVKFHRLHRYDPDALTCRLLVGLE